MTRATVALAIFLFASASLQADVTLTSKTSASGQFAALAGAVMPHMLMRIQSSRERIDVEVMGQAFSQILDLSTKRSILLNHVEKTATVVGANLTPFAGAAPKAGAKPPNVHVERTGRTKEIGGQLCDEYALSVKSDMSAASAPGLPPGAAEMLKDVSVVIKGSVWIATGAPGATEYSAFQKAAREANMWVGPSNPGMRPPRELDPTIQVLDYVEGIPFLAELETTFDGAGPIVDMMKQMGGLQMTHSITSVSTAPVASDIFEIPADYTVVK